MTRATAKRSSRLLKLPAELRNLIYELVLCYVHPFDIGSGSSFSTKSLRPRSRYAYPHNNLFGLLRTCRQVYAEAWQLGYMNNTFLLTSLLHARSFLRMIGGPNARCLRRVQFNTTASCEQWFNHTRRLEFTAKLSSARAVKAALHPKCIVTLIMTIRHTKAFHCFDQFVLFMDVADVQGSWDRAQRQIEVRFGDQSEQHMRLKKLLLKQLEKYRRLSITKA
jgi:hypothetical protein